MKLVDFKENKSLYAVVFAGMALGVMDHFGVKTGWIIDWGLKFLGRSELREAIRAKSRESADDIVTLAEDILAQVKLPEEPPSPLLQDGPVVPTVHVQVEALSPVDLVKD